MTLYLLDGNVIQEMHAGGHPKVRAWLATVKLSDEALASLAKCALDLGPDNLLDGAYVKRLHPRREARNNTDCRRDSYTYPLKAQANCRKPRSEAPVASPSRTRRPSKKRHFWPLQGSRGHEAIPERNWLRRVGWLERSSGA